MAKHFVRVGDIAVGNGSHGCSCCGHALVGRWVKGANTVLTNGRPTIRAFVDIGIHNCPHCGVMVPLGKIDTVIIEGSPQHFKGGLVNFNCGMGNTITASDNVV